MERSPELIDYISVVFRWWKFILTGTLIITALAVVSTFVMTPYYTTEATVLVSKSKVAEEGKEPDTTYTEIESYTTLLENNSAALAAMDKFRLREAPHEMTLRSFQRLLKVRFLPKTDIVTISFSFPDAALCQQITRFLIDRAIETNRELNRSEALESQKFLATELKRASDTREQIQTRLSEYRKSSDSGSVEGFRNAALRNVGVLDELRRTVESEVANGEAALVEAEKRQAGLSRTIETKSILSKNATYEQLVSRMTDRALVELLSAPFLIEMVSSSYEQSQAELVRIATKLAGDRAQLQKLNESLADLQAKAEQWNQELAIRREVIKDLSDQYEVSNKVYEQLAMRYNEATVTVGSRSQDLRLVDAPFQPEKKSWPQTGLIALISLQLGLLVLTLTAFLLDYVGRRRSRL